MTSQHHVSELDAINGTKSGPSRDQVLFKSSTQLATQSPTQLHKISSSKNGIKSVSIQVGEQVIEQVSSTNHREHRGHRDLASEILNLQNHHKPCDELVTQQMTDTICYPVGSELNTGFNPRLVTLHDMKEGNYDE